MTSSCPWVQRCSSIGSVTQKERNRTLRFDDFSDVYGNGEFTWDGFWTVTDPPPETHDGLISAWEMYPGPVTRWRLPVRPRVRLWTINHPTDWVRLVESYPKVASRGHDGWELPGANQHLTEIQDHLCRSRPARCPSDPFAPRLAGLGCSCQSLRRCALELGGILDHRGLRQRLGGWWGNHASLLAK